MKINISNVKDCKNCKNAEVYGTGEEPTIECMSTDSTHYNNFNKDGRYCAAYCKGYKDKGDLDNQLGKIPVERSLPFILAGKSEFVLHSTKTNQNFRYKMTKKESTRPDKQGEFIYFLNIQFGNEWKYAGVVWFNEQTSCFVFNQGQKGQVEYTDLNIRSLMFVLNKLVQNQLPQHCEVYHIGRCGKCGKKLTTPESILTGLGPTCSKMSGVPRVKIK